MYFSPGRHNAQTQELDWFQQSRKVLGLPKDLCEWVSLSTPDPGGIKSGRAIIPGDSLRLSQCSTWRPSLSPYEDPTTGVPWTGQQQAQELPQAARASSSQGPALRPQMHGTHHNSHLCSPLPCTTHLSQTFADFSQPHQVKIFIFRWRMTKLRLKLAANHINWFVANSEFKARYAFHKAHTFCPLVWASVLIN